MSLGVKPLGLTLLKKQNRVSPPQLPQSQQLSPYLPSGEKQMLLTEPLKW